MVRTEPAMTESSRRRRAIAPRAALADLALCVLSVVPQLVRTTDDGRGSHWIDGGAAVLAVVLIVWRRRQPIPALAVGLVGVVAVTAATGRPTAMVPASIVLLFEVARRTDRRTAVIAGACGMLAVVACVGMLDTTTVHGPELLAGIAWPALAVAAGDAVRSRREAIAAADERAARAEATREEEARRRVAEERLHIARELHDVVAHQIAVINVQSGVAAHLLRNAPDGAETALATVRSAAQQVLDELSAMLGVLRAADEDTQRNAPTPGVADIGRLVESFTQTGLRITLETTGEQRDLDAGVGIALYRTVQEALTNAQKHGRGTAAVRIAHAADAVEVTVSNPIGDASATTSGFGLVGMRERVTAAGGTLVTGPQADGSFVVDARFPRTRREVTA